MKRIILATAGVAVVAVFAATLGSRAAGGHDGCDRRRQARAEAEAAAAAGRGGERKRWNIGVKCDSPPFGYIDVQGKNAGFDVEIAKWFSRFAFGRANRVTFTVRHDARP